MSNNYWKTFKINELIVLNLRNSNIYEKNKGIEISKDKEFGLFWHLWNFRVIEIKVYSTHIEELKNPHKNS